MDLPLYLDHHSTTPVCPEAQDAMCRAITCGNAASAHGWGEVGAGIMADARQEIASGLGSTPAEVFFTSGATEGNNLALRGVLDAFMREGIARRHVIVSAIEHSSVIATAQRLAALGRCTVTVLPIGPSGIVDPADVAAALAAHPDTALVSVMHANNEVGTIQPVERIGAICRAMKVLFHTDASQSFLRVPLDAPAVSDIVTVTAHKVYGPKGIGAIFLRRGMAGWIEPQFYGGTHEDGVRAGTANVCGAAGFAAASRWLRREWPAAEGRIRCLRDKLLAGLMALGHNRVRVNGALAARLPHNLNVTLIGVCPVELHRELKPQIAVSSAAACKAIGGERSHVLAALGEPDDGAPVRFGLGLSTTERDIARAIGIVAQAADRLYGAGCAIPAKSEACPGGVCDLPHRHQPAGAIEAQLTGRNSRI